MKIYQVHKMGVYWEDAYDHIIGTFLNKSNAQKFLNNKHTTMKKYKMLGQKCLECYGDITQQHKTCFVPDDDVDCINEMTKYAYDDIRYEIKEEEVNDA